MIKAYDSLLLAKYKHGFFTRMGGYSEGNYASLNLGHNTNDHIGHIKNNKKLIANYFNIKSHRLITMTQPHGNEAILINEDNYDKAHIGDAMVTQTENIAIAVLTADCTPILIADTKANIIAAIHAGWRSTHSGIIQNTVNLMQKLGSKTKDMMATIGPTISQKHYEVTKDFAKLFPIEFFLPQDNHKYLFNLGAFNLAQLKQLNIMCDNLNLCTYANPNEFFSHRRTTHAKEQDCGRQISAIML